MGLFLFLLEIVCCRRHPISFMMTAGCSATLVDSTDEYDSDYDPEREVRDCETDSVSSVETLSASEGEQSRDDAASAPPSSGPAGSCFTLLSDPYADKQPDVLPSLKQDFDGVYPGIIAHHQSPVSRKHIWSLISIRVG